MNDNDLITKLLNLRELAFAMRNELSEMTENSDQIPNNNGVFMQEIFNAIDASREAARALTALLETQS
jgi:hypothetical protein